MTSTSDDVQSLQKIIDDARYNNKVESFVNILKIESMVNRKYKCKKKNTQSRCVRRRLICSTSFMRNNTEDMINKTRMLFCIGNGDAKVLTWDPSKFQLEFDWKTLGTSGNIIKKFPQFKLTDNSNTSLLLVNTHDTIAMKYVTKTQKVFSSQKYNPFFEDMSSIALKPKTTGTLISSIPKNSFW
jgi:hypothetical protein